MLHLYRGRRPWAYLWINTASQELNQRVFDALLTYKDEIAKQVTSTVEWRRNDDQCFSSIGVSRDGSIWDPDQRWSEIRDWMFHHILELKRAIDPFLETVMADSQNTV